jgi:translation elongation factor EF-4
MIVHTVSYILGGRESHVDAVFIKLHSNEKTKRKEAELPKSLLQALGAQGFDTAIVAAAAITKKAVTAKHHPAVKKEVTTKPTPAEKTKKKPSPPVLKDGTNQNNKRTKLSDNKAATRK